LAAVSMLCYIDLIWIFDGTALLPDCFFNGRCSYCCFCRLPPPQATGFVLCASFETERSARLQAQHIRACSSRLWPFGLMQLI